ncbi:MULTISPECIES: glycine-rich domain-containing protein [Nocardiaceae]|uniref:glycine-rich domain-containing protein n=1 Tax=Nocardiaceae TaxID=85025 RepID=UPI0002ACF05A|nr:MULTISPECIES: hypothetical protein [Rhodococcus]MCC8930089.1 hypothetical protein [Rhodococcus sp. I2R]MDJ0471318.1 hypothetical protein [Rhodococcus fascians]CCQ13410.1 putative uncharacterized protein [Rhodococcus sp. AW25M09]
MENTPVNRHDNCSACGGGGGEIALSPAQTAEVVDRRTLAIDEALRLRLVKRVEQDYEFNARVSSEIQGEHRTAVAERIVHQTIGFLTLVAKNPGIGFSPSSLVDIGWHNFILYTREYTAWCQETGGRYIHHAPFDEAGVDYGTGHSHRTVDALREFGWLVDEELWASKFVYDCGTCNVGGYDCTSTDGGNVPPHAPHSVALRAPNNGNCGSQDCSDACGGPDGLVGRARAALAAPNNGSCGSQDCSDACGGGSTD